MSHLSHSGLACFEKHDFDGTLVFSLSIHNFSSMHLKSSQDYIDRYDQLTVERCRQHEGFFKKQLAEIDEKDPEFQMKKSATELALRLSIYFYVGEEAVRKESAVQEWMDRDRHMDEVEENAQAPTGIHCLKCRELMSSDFKTLEDGDRILFSYDCPNNCVPRRCFYDNGEEWFPTPEKCSKCRADVAKETKKKGRTITTILTCPSCKHVESSEWVMSKPKKPVPDESFEVDRARFCLDKKKLDEYIEGKRNVAELSAFLEKHKDRDKFKKVDVFLKGIKMLNLAGIQSVLGRALEAKGFAEFDTAAPSSAHKSITINFTAQDSLADRDSKTAKQDFKDGVITALRETNWRLMESTVEYNLGLVTGRLKGYQNQSELRELIEKEIEEEQITVELEANDPKGFGGITL